MHLRCAHLVPARVYALAADFTSCFRPAPCASLHCPVRFTRYLTRYCHFTFPNSSAKSPICNPKTQSLSLLSRGSRGKNAKSPIKSVGFTGSRGWYPKAPCLTTLRVKHPQPHPTAVDSSRSATPARVFSLSPFEGERVGERGPLVPDLLNSMALQPHAHPTPALCHTLCRA